MLRRVNSHYPTRQDGKDCRCAIPWPRSVDQHLVTLLVKLAVAASLASILVRSNRFLRMLMKEERTILKRIEMALVCGALFGGSVATRSPLTEPMAVWTWASKAA